MFRTTIMLPETLKLKFEKEAKKEKVSFGELVRRALEKYLLVQEDPWKNDSFFSSKTVFNDDGPTDMAERHDYYLYDPEQVDVHKGFIGDFSKTKPLCTSTCSGS